MIIFSVSTCGKRITSAQPKPVSFSEAERDALVFYKYMYKKLRNLC